MTNTLYWFIPKVFGWGFMPVTWQGWLALTILLGLILLSAYVNGLFIKRDKNDFAFLYSKDMIRFILDTIILVTVFTLSIASKVDGGLAWRFL